MGNPVVFPVAALNDILKLFKREAGVTSQELAAEFGVSRPTAYAYIRAVKAAGVQLDVTEQKTGHRGPPVKRFRCDPSVQIIEEAVTE